MTKIPLGSLAVLIYLLKNTTCISGFSNFLKVPFASISNPKATHTIFHQPAPEIPVVISTPPDGNVNAAQCKLFHFQNIFPAALFALTFILPSVTVAAPNINDGASKAENAKITTGGASTLQSGRTIAITR